MKISWRTFFLIVQWPTSHICLWFACALTCLLIFLYCYYSCFNKRDGFQACQSFAFFVSAFLDVTIFIHFISPVLIWNESQEVVHYYVQVSIEIDCFCPNGIRLLNNNVANFNVFAYWAKSFHFHFSFLLLMFCNNFCLLILRLCMNKQNVHKKNKLYRNLHLFCNKNNNEREKRILLRSNAA